MLPPGSTIRNFEIIATLGQGGMGLVYRARQPSMGREVALKEMSFGAQGNPDFAARFVQEARIGGLLSHPNVVVVYDYFEAGGAAYIAMELVERGPLTPLMSGLTLVESLGVLEALLSALSHAGDVGIVHRDLKPANLLVTRNGTLKVADFGIAKALDATAHLGLTATGIAVGTPVYMAPEQAEGAEVDHRTDLYATGVLAYEMLAGRLPFDPELSLPAVMYKHVHEQPPSPHSVNPDLHPAFGEWIERMLAKRPDDRPPSGAAAWAQLEEITVEHLGWRWRRDARLPDGARSAERLPLTPAPFERAEPDSGYDTFGAPPREAAPLSPVPAPAEATVPPSVPISQPESDRIGAPGARRSRRVPLAVAAAGTAVAVAVAVVVIGAGGGSDGDRSGAATATRDPDAPSSTPTEDAFAPNKDPAKPADLQQLQAMVPASLRDSCEPDPSQFGDDLARVRCDRWGATFYYELYADELDARHWFSIGATGAKDDARGRAASCRDAREARPFVGPWGRSGETKPRGQLTCTYDSSDTGGVVRRDWSENGRPILAALLYSGSNRRDAAEGAELAWNRATE